MTNTITNQDNLFFGKTEIIKQAIRELRVDCELVKRGRGGFGVHFYSAFGDHIDVIAIDAEDVGEVFHHLLYAFDNPVDIKISGDTEEKRNENLTSNMIEFSIGYIE